MSIDESIEFGSFSYLGYHYFLTHKNKSSHPFYIAKTETEIIFQAIQDTWFQVMFPWEKLEEMEEAKNFPTFKFQKAISPSHRNISSLEFTLLKKETIAEFTVEWISDELTQDGINRLNCVSLENPDIRLEIEIYYRFGNATIACPVLIWKQSEK